MLSNYVQKINVKSLKNYEKVYVNRQDGSVSVFTDTDYTGISFQFSSWIINEFDSNR